MWTITAQVIHSPTPSHLSSLHTIPTHSRHTPPPPHSPSTAHTPPTTQAFSPPQSQILSPHYSNWWQNCTTPPPHPHTCPSIQSEDKSVYNTLKVRTFFHTPLNMPGTYKERITSIPPTPILWKSEDSAHSHKARTEILTSLCQNVLTLNVKNWFWSSIWMPGRTHSQLSSHSCTQKDIQRSINGYLCEPLQHRSFTHQLPVTYPSSTLYWPISVTLFPPPYSLPYTHTPLITWTFTPPPSHWSSLHIKLMATAFPLHTRHYRHTIHLPSLPYTHPTPNTFTHLPQSLILSPN